MRELLRAFAGQTVDGAIFGLSGKLTLPTFTRVEPYVAPDNAWELDGLAEACTEPFDTDQDRPGRSDGERWAVEVKWRNSRADYTDVTHFHVKALDLKARPWFIAKTGLTSSAEEYAREKGILVSTERELQLLAERLGVRFGKRHLPPTPFLRHRVPEPDRGSGPHPICPGPGLADHHSYLCPDKAGGLSPGAQGSLRFLKVGDRGPKRKAAGRTVSRSSGGFAVAARKHAPLVVSQSAPPRAHSPQKQRPPARQSRLSPAAHEGPQFIVGMALLGRPHQYKHFDDAQDKAQCKLALHC